MQTRHTPHKRSKAIKGPFRVSTAATGLLALLLIGSLALMACGGGGSEPAAPATAAPASGQTSGGAQATEAPASSGLSPSDSFSEVVLVLPRGFETLEVNLRAGDRVMVTYSSESRAYGGYSEAGVGGKPGVVFAVHDPVGDSVFQSEQIAEGSHDFVAELNGTHQLIFQNPELRNQQQVELEYSINP